MGRTAGRAAIGPAGGRAPEAPSRAQRRRLARIERAGAALALAAAVLLAACGQRAEPSPSANGASTNAGALGTSTALGGAAAKVGEQPIAPELVASVARAQRASPRDATRTLVDEALLAEAAIRAGALRDPIVVRQIEAARARAMVARRRDEALARGPITDAEIEAAMGEEWVDLDAPEARTTVHALVPKDTPNADSLATELRARLLPAKDAAGFLAAAEAFGKEKGVKIVAEAIETPFALDGRIVQRGAAGMSLDLAFCKAAFALAKPGDRSETVTSQFGIHVIELVSVIPEKRASREKKIQLLSPVIVKNRIWAAFEAERVKLRVAANETTTASSADLTAPRFVNAPPGAPEGPR